MRLASLYSIRVRGTVMAANRKTRYNNTVTSRQYGRCAIDVPRDVRFQDGGAVDLSKLEEGLFLPSFPSFFQCLHAMVQRPVRHSGTFCLCKRQVKVRGV